MNVTIPIYIEEQHADGSAVPIHFVRPLFFPAPSAKGEHLGHTVTKLAKELRRTLDDLGKKMRHDELAAYCFAPEVEDHLLKLSLDLGRQRVNCRFLMVRFDALGRRLVFSPNIPGLCLDLERGESLHDRAVEVLTRHFRERDRRGGRDIPHPDQISLKGKAWTTTLELDIYPPQVARPSVNSLFALLGTTTEMDGAQELRRVGRCFDWLYPDELSRAICREAEVEELTKLLAAPDKSPVLLVGPRSAGKTAIIEEHVYRKVEKRRAKHAEKNNLWLISPQRLISWMSYVGQWENRLLAIITEARLRDHVLYFDDLLGMYHAGVSASSNLNVAHVIKPYIERQEVRLLAEITPEAFRVFQERDRGFADLLRILPVKEPTEDETFRILLSLIRQLEHQHQCQFDPEVLPAALDLQRRYVRDAVFPGKAASFLRQLAVKYRGSGVDDAAITRRNVLEEFQAKSGMSVGFIDTETKLERQEVIESLGREVVGQPAALNSAADVVCIAKARLNDPDRPLASFLFLGPTGVGKTQCAKSLARYLFGDAEKILRFDMNEFISPAAVARLVGTFDQPEGLLTSAIRRQPFSVVLLDEIEKAHRDVFDLLLQVLGEGRLTDALGRTADFTNAILILTSNLGVKEAGSNLGFRQSEESQAGTYLQAVEKFFRPEFFNRLDRIVPFERLRRADVAGIARHLIQDVFAREGLVRRKCILRVDDRAMERIIDAGYHPLLGARALKRAIEKQLTQPVAAQLAPLRPETPTVISLYATAADIAVQVQPLVQAEPRRSITALIESEDPQWIIEGVEEFIERAEAEAETLRPAGAISLDEIDPGHYRYFTIREQTKRLRRACQRLERMIAAPKRPASVMAGSVSRPKSLKYVADAKNAASKNVRRDILAVEDIQAELRDLAATANEPEDAVTTQLRDVVRESALLNVLLGDGADDSPAQALIYIRPLIEASVNPIAAYVLDAGRVRGWYEKLFAHQLGVQSASVTDESEKLLLGAERLLVRGAPAFTLASREQGTHLFFFTGQHLWPIQVRVFPVGDGEDPDAVIGAHLSAREQWQEPLAAGRVKAEDDPFRLEPVIRVYDQAGVTADLRSGMFVEGLPSPDDLRAFLLSSLLLPEELIIEGEDD